MLKSAVCIISAAATCAAATAGPVVYFDRDINFGDQRLESFPNSQSAENTFKTQLNSWDMNSIEAAVTDSVNPTLDFGSFGTGTIENAIVRDISASLVNNGRYPIAGTKYLAQYAPVMTLNFSQPQVAFGFWGVDIGDFGGILTVTLMDGGIQEFVINPVGMDGEGSGSVFFWGFVDTENPFTAVNFTNSTGVDDVFAYDNFSVGSVSGIPLPTSLSLGSVALAGLVLTRRRRPSHA